MNARSRSVVVRRTSSVLAAWAGLALGIGTAVLPAGAWAQPAAHGGEAAHAAGDPLPIRRITLYRSGVGYFLRAGNVDGTQRVQLKFDAPQINDVLKSLQVLDRSGGRVDAVSYASKDPLSRRLGSFALQIGDNPSVPALLERLRGSPVTLETLEGKVSGQVLSVEMRKVAAGGGKPGESGPVIDQHFVNLLTGTGMQSVSVASIRSFKIDDAALAEDLNKALAALSESRAERVKTVDLQLSGDGTRDIAVAYVHETPVWKTSYRLVLPEGAGGTPEGDKSVLQGWAIVENTTDSDWTDVRLALVSGRPVSFQMDLYEPLYVFRPMIPVPTVPGVMPKAYEEGMNAMPVLASAAPPPSASPASPGGMPREAAKRMRGTTGGGEGGDRFYGIAMEAKADGDAGRPISAGEMVDYAAKPVAQGGEVGEQFQFELAAPVTIERQRSAMIPLLASPVSGKRVSIYNRSDRADHPMRGVQLTNDTNLQLLPGPISVYDGAAYAGDAQINQIAVGDNRLLAYAVDLDVAVTTTPIEASTTTKLRIVQGSFEVTVKRESGMTYRFVNKDLKRARSLIIEHPKYDGWDLTSPAKPEEGKTPGIEQTASQYRFPLALEAGKTNEVTVRQERTERQTIGIDSYEWETLARFSKDGKLSEAVLNALRELRAKRTAAAEAQRAVEQTDQQLETLRREQTRITSMLSSLDRQTDAYKNLLQKVNTQEKSIDSLSAQRGEQVAKVERLNAELNAYLAGLNVE